MSVSKVMHFKVLSMFFIITIVKDCKPVRFSYLGVPGYSLKGQSVWLHCAFDLEQDYLYSVKWYKDNVEFYRYLPSDNPPGQMYKLNGVFLDMQKSNATHVFLNSSDLESEGTYGCEVSTEVPSFRTIRAGKTMYVYVIPEEDPILFVSSTYDIGSELNATCIHGPSKPAASLTWYINGKRAPHSYVRERSDNDGDNLEISESRLSFVIDQKHFFNRGLSIRCKASISLVYSNSSQEVVIMDGAYGNELQHDSGEIDQRMKWMQLFPQAASGYEIPIITGNERQYTVGDLLHVNCTSAKSLKPAQLQWYMNDYEADPSVLKQYNPVKYSDGYLSTKLGLQFRIRKEHFIYDEMNLKCTSTLSKVLHQTTEEKIIGNFLSSGFQEAYAIKFGWNVESGTNFNWTFILSCMMFILLS